MVTRCSDHSARQVSRGGFVVILASFYVESREASMSQTSDLIQSAQRTIRLEAEAVESLLTRIDADFVRACEMILTCKGRVVVVGMGKSGHIGNKIAATLASTGTPAYFVHPAEASHGDLGMILRQDVLIALSNSGESAELLAIVPISKSAWWEGCRTGRYPKPIKLGSRTTVWRAEDITAFIESLGKNGAHHE